MKFKLLVLLWMSMMIAGTLLMFLGDEYQSTAWAFVFLAGIFPGAISFSDLSLRDLFMRQSIVLVLALSSTWSLPVSFCALVLYVRQRRDRQSDAIWALRKPIEAQLVGFNLLLFKSAQNMELVILHIVIVPFAWPMFPIFLLSTWFLSRFLPKWTALFATRIAVLVLLPMTMLLRLLQSLP